MEVASAVGVKVIARGEAWTNYPVTMTVDDIGDGFLLMAKADRCIGAERVIEILRTAEIVAVRRWKALHTRLLSRCQYCLRANG